MVAITDFTVILNCILLINQKLKYIDTISSFDSSHNAEKWGGKNILWFFFLDHAKNQMAESTS